MERENEWEIEIENDAAKTLWPAKWFYLLLFHIYVDDFVSVVPFFSFSSHLSIIPSYRQPNKLKPNGLLHEALKCQSNSLTISRYMICTFQVTN